MAGYSLNQSLEWTLEDSVIEGYAFMPDERVEIRHSGKIDVYEKQDAEKLNLGGSIEDLYNAVAVAELAAEKGAETLLMPVSARRQLLDLSDDMAARVNIQFYTDARDALLKALDE